MIRLPAEWEEQSFVQVAFPHENSDWSCCIKEVEKNFVELIEAIAKYEDCLVICDSKDRVKSFFKKLDNIYFYELPTNDTWSRDFGAITIYEDEEAKLLDFGFNGWGLKFGSNFDNQITSKLFENGVFEDIKCKTMPIVLEGGSIESNGNGVILTTSECLLEKNRNPHLSQKKIEKRLKKYFGANEILWLNSGYLEGDDTNSHIDTIVRFVSRDSIMYIFCDDENDTHYEEFKKMEKELQNFKQPNGKNYNLIKLPWVSAIYDGNDRLPATYANFLIINNAVLVPTYHDKNDKIALSIFRDFFKDRDVVGIDCSTLIKQHGSLHCVTMQYPAGVRLNKNLLNS